MDFIVQKWSIKPKKVFLIDGLGALLSIFLLGFVLPRLDKFIGMGYIKKEFIGNNDIYIISKSNKVHMEFTDLPFVKHNYKR